MKKIVITGFSGFVASHFVEFLYNRNEDVRVYGLDRGAVTYDYERYTDRIPIEFEQIDLMDSARLRMIISDIRPDYILHLASFSSVAYSWKHPEESFSNNCNIFLNLVDAVRQACPKCRILSVGSSEEYGDILHADLPLRENQPLNPISPYAVARVSQELLSKVYVHAFGMQIIMTRSFNHVGPRQDERFVIPSFIRRILDIKRSGKEAGEIDFMGSLIPHIAVAVETLPVPVIMEFRTGHRIDDRRRTAPEAVIDFLRNRIDAERSD